jgi:methylphosphotriester-DNA--protein-cysteine methyltransferase
MSDTKKLYTLLGADGGFYKSEVPGLFGGNRKLKIYGRLDCFSANRYLDKGYAKIRVFFASEGDAIKAGYRPCGKCMREAYKVWKATCDKT